MIDLQNDLMDISEILLQCCHVLNIDEALDDKVVLPYISLRSWKEDLKRKIEYIEMNYTTSNVIQLSNCGHVQTIIRECEVHIGLLLTMWERRGKNKDDLFDIIQNSQIAILKLVSFYNAKVKSQGHNYGLTFNPFKRINSTNIKKSYNSLSKVNIFW